jgi:hypothetical protein
MLAEITFAVNRHFGMVDNRHSKVEGNTAIGRKGRDSSTIIPTIPGTSSCGLSITVYAYMYKKLTPETYASLYLS